MGLSGNVEYRYYLRGYDEAGVAQFEIASSRKHLAIALSIYELDGPPSGVVGRWRIAEEMWPELSRTLDWPERRKGLEYFIESESVDD